MDYLRNLITPPHRFDTSEEFHPGWRNLFSASDYFDFLSMLLAYLRRRQIGFTLKKDALILENGDSKIDLENLARLCSQQPRQQWKQSIEAYFQKSTAVMAAVKSPASMDFSLIAPLLAVRLLPAGTLIAVGKENLVYRQDLEGTITELVLDLPERLQSILPGNAVQWHKSEAELFEMALENVRRNLPLEMRPQELAGGPQGYMMIGGALTTAHALLLETHPEVMGRHGCLFAIPSRSVIVCCPVEDARILEAIPAFIPLVIELFEAGPGSISPGLYWFDRSHYHSLPVDVQRKTVDHSDGLNELVKLFHL